MKTTSLLIKETETLEIEAFKRPKDTKSLKNTHVAFSGSPRKHPYDPYKVILMADPFNRNAFYYEFRIEDVSYVEELPSLVNVDEEVIPVVRIWIKKSSVGLRCTPFWVEDLM